MRLIFRRCSDKQTLSFLLRRFREAGIQPRTHLGQNFLIDMNLQRVLLETARSARTTSCWRLARAPAD